MEQYLHLYVWCTVESQNGKLVMGRHLAQTCRVRLRSDHTLTINEPLWSLSKSSYCSYLGSHLHKQNAPRGEMKKASIVYENTLSLSFMCSLRGREGRSQTELFSTNESEGYCSQIYDRGTLAVGAMHDDQNQCYCFPNV